MSNFIDQLSMTPQERRIVMAIVAVLFLVVNAMLVWPHFGDWGRIQKDLDQTYRTIETYNREIALDVDPTNGLKKQLAKLEKIERQESVNAGRLAQSEVHLEKTIHDLAIANKIDVDKS